MNDLNYAENPIKFNSYNNHNRQNKYNVENLQATRP